jgi:serine/threonine-protein kinase
MGIVPPDEGWPKAEWAVTKALELDDQLAEAHLDLAALKMVYYLDWVGAERESKRAIELSPGFDEIRYTYSFFLVAMRRFRGAIAEGKRWRAIRFPSASAGIWATPCTARSYDKAIRQYKKAIDLDPNDASVREALGDTYERKGQYQEAVEQWAKAMVLENDTELVATLGAAKTKEAVPAIRFAREHLRAGHQEEALKWLTLACEERNVYSLMIASDPFYDPLCTDRRFVKLLRRMKLDG